MDKQHRVALTDLLSTIGPVLFLSNKTHWNVLLADIVLHVYYVVLD